MNPVRVMMLRRHIRQALLALDNGDVEQAKWVLNLMKGNWKA
jgi:hypothetical protein